MGKTDSLSRKPDWKVGVEKNNKDQVFIKDHWICNLLEVVIKELEIDILEKIKKTRGKNKEVVKAVEEIKKVRVKNLRGNKWEIKEESVLKEGKVYVPKDEELRMEIV